MARVLRGFETVERADGLVWRVFAAQGNEGDVQVYVSEQVTSRDAILWAVLQSLLTPLLLALPVLGVFGWLMVRHALRPLRALGQSLANRQPQAMEAIVLSDVPAEMEPVLQALNQLLDRINHMLTAERRFTADAAHELRTPIAAIRMQAQVALGAGDDDTPGRTRALQQTLAGCDRATHLVEQLLTLSRLESSSSGALVGQVNLSALAQRVAADLALTALQRRQTLSLEAAQPALIAADETLTGVLLRNLLDNALRYSPADARVCVSVDLMGTQVCLQVDDSGPGLPDADLARLGERFFRVLGTGQSGSGLGWSIVRRIALVYQAEVNVQRSALLGGLCVRVVWPAAVPTASAPGR
jgi:two-component system sensor histidine kinase QseC